MTTCAITECRSEGALLLHIRHKRENLLQAEYCPEHFCEQTKQWNQDIAVTIHYPWIYFYQSDSYYGKEMLSRIQALNYVWRIKDQLPKDCTNDDIHKAIALQQQAVYDRIKDREDYLETNFGSTRKFTNTNLSK